MEKINIAELLKDCPTGMELDSTLFEGLEFDSIVDNEYLPIRCRIKHPDGGYTVYNFTKYGYWLDTTFAKCVIFPKGKTTWEGFQRPFKDGDVLVGKGNQPFIFKKLNNRDGCFSHCGIDSGHRFLLASTDWAFANSLRFATEEEKQKLFKAIKDNGYRWNQETKTLEKLPNFNAGDVLVSETGNIVLLSHIDSRDVVHYHCIIPPYSSLRIEENTSVGVGRYYDCVLANEEQRQRMYDRIKSSGYKYNQNTNKLEKLIEPKFKVGDKIVKKNGICVPILIAKVGDEFYYSNTKSSVGVLPISEQNDWKLVPIVPKFKAGDKIKHRLTGDVYKISSVLSDGCGGGVYNVNVTNELGKSIDIEYQDSYELVYNKFDITTLNEFESRVLVRDYNNDIWRPAIFGAIVPKTNHDDLPFVVVGGCFYEQCIPFEGNEHLLGTTNDCDEYYKTWE